jgi:hypothetical protein
MEFVRTFSSISRPL